MCNHMVKNTGLKLGLIQHICNGLVVAYTIWVMVSKGVN